MKITAVLVFFASIQVVTGSECDASTNTASSTPVKTSKGCCSFPFKYYRRTITGCNDLRSDDPECITTSGEWGVCPKFGYFGPSTTIKKDSCKSKLHTYKGNANGKCCVFPFTYDNKEYNECTDVESTYRWCATTDNFEKDWEYGQCPDQEYCPSHVYTTGGTAKGACCVFPFKDGDKVHHSCADPEVGSDKKHKWCATTDNYAKDGMWGYCSNNETCSSGVYTAFGNSDYACCHFPFKYKGNTYDKCIEESDGSSWCATTPEYDEDKGIGKYGDCPKKRTCTKEKQTYGGNANRDCCVFPFTYNGKLYRACTDDDSQIGKWCATTDNFDRDRKYGFCEGKCVFPFIYKNLEYNSCTRKDFGRSWCSTTTNFDQDQKYSFCEGIDYCTAAMPKAIAPNTDEYACCVFPFIYKGKTYDSCTTVDFGRKWCSLTSNYDRDGLHGYCESSDYCSLSNPKAISPNSKELSCCYFPFTYKGETYNDCTSVDYGRKWCSLTSDMDRDGLYGYCESSDYCSAKYPKAISPNSQELPCCHFPFTYKGKTYHSCTTVDYGRKWCSLTSDGDKGGLYGYCESTDYCTAKNPKAISPNTKELSCCHFPFTYKGKTYNECTSVDYGRKWCSLTSSMDGQDKLYGYCESSDYCSATRPQTFGGNSKELPCCHFPFTYKGRTFNKCTNYDSNGAWCATTSSFIKDKLSGYCGAAKSVDSRCKFQLGRGNGKLSWQGKRSWKNCIERCLELKQSKKSINGVRVYGTEEKKRCFCISNMKTSKNKISNYISCFLEETDDDYMYKTERDMYHESDWY